MRLTPGLPQSGFGSRFREPATGVVREEFDVITDSLAELVLGGMRSAHARELRLVSRGHCHRL